MSSSALHRTHTVVTRILPVEVSAISFEEDGVSAPSSSATDSASVDDTSLRKIETCTPIISSDETLQALKAAAYHLTFDLEPVAFPTETVYGLGAVASTTDTAKRIYELKGRPADNPLIVHVSSLQMLREQVLPPAERSTSTIPTSNALPNTPPTYLPLMRAFWPGPLTLLFPAGELAEGRVPSIITAGHPSVAVRMPAHPVARALIAITNKPLAAPSANSSGRPSPTKAEHVFKDMNGKVGIILDDGRTADVGLESTVVDGLQEDGHLRVLRPGGVTVEDLRRVLDEAGMHDVKVLVHKKDYDDAEQESAPTTPGMKYRHYSPTVPVVLLVRQPSPNSSDSTSNTHRHPAEDIPSFINSLVADLPPEQNITLGLLLNTDSPLLPAIQSTISSIDRVSSEVHELGTIATPEVTAQRLFDGLLTLDNDGVDVILVEAVEETKQGLAVMNRVRKAAGETRYVSI